MTVDRGGFHVRARDFIRDRLREGILDGTLQPGEEVAVAEVASWLGVPVTPVHPAMVALEMEGLLEVGQYAARVAVVDSDRIDEHLYTLGLLRAGAIECTLPELSPVAEAAIVDLVDRARSAAADGDLPEHDTSSAELWQVFVDACPNQALRRAYATTAPGLVHKSRLAGPMSPENSDRLAEGYDALRWAVTTRGLAHAVRATQRVHALGS
ncbi:GntR family transcriptional regulator [Leifsonia shinshuensis]|uniref:GntR family transcriptional regulator n=1 Tax=Leifsonia shinshuensis TaxID=150026 RepID=UPI002858DE83|nr:GntR family transcriptional regulator [Leifsonia shinshuensis]MDR6972942.1 DNA-binding GntR family transcriptional regulator [Leifsonia shinshuensis]